MKITKNANDKTPCSKPLSSAPRRVSDAQQAFNRSVKIDELGLYADTLKQPALLLFSMMLSSTRNRTAKWEKTHRRISKHTPSFLCLSSELGGGYRTIKR